VTQTLFRDNRIENRLLGEHVAEQYWRCPMIQFICDSCAAIKEPSEVWILGFAAESVGVTAARREVTIQSAWDRPTAVHPMAVHFCSVECKDNYMARLFAPEASAEQVVVASIPQEKAETAPVAKVSRATRTETRMHRKKRAA